MCVMCVGTTANERPTRANLVVSCINNPDGFGWGIVYDAQVEGTPTRRLMANHSMTSESAIDSYFAALDQLGEAVVGHLFHARIATRGGVHLKGCHPFWVPEGEREYDTSALLAHNGMLGLSIPKNDQRVDSQVFAEDVLPMFGGVESLNKPYMWDIINGYVEGERSKVVILNTIFEESPVIILGESLGSWDKNTGLWWSNTSWCSTPSYRTPANVTYGSRMPARESTWSDYDMFESKSTMTEDEYEELFGGMACLDTTCPGWVLPEDGHLCLECGVCQMCLDTWDECICEDIRESLPTEKQ